MPLTLADAREAVKTNCQAALDPVLTDAEVEAILTATVRGAAWAAGTAHAVGAVVLPTTATGRAYRVVTGGTSGASEPTWPTASFAVVTSGTVTYQEAGPTDGERYDVRRATWEAYQLKLAKIAGTAVNLSTPGGTIALQQMSENLERRARRWVPVEVC